MAIGLTTIKRFPYRGDTTEEFSNHYHLTGSDPSDSAAWRTLFDAFIAQEKTFLTSAADIIGGYGYVSDSPTAHSVWSVDLRIAPNSPVTGTLSPTSGAHRVPGDCAIWLRWGLDRLNSKGKRVYLRKYYHDVAVASGGIDAVDANQLSALLAFGATLQTGGILGHTIRDTAGAAVLGHAASTYVTTRTLKRRGKRPT